MTNPQATYSGTYLQCIRQEDFALMEKLSGHEFTKDFKCMFIQKKIENCMIFNKYRQSVVSIEETINQKLLSCNNPAKPTFYLLRKLDKS